MYLSTSGRLTYKAADSLGCPRASARARLWISARCLAGQPSALGRELPLRRAEGLGRSRSSSTRSAKKGGSRSCRRLSAMAAPFVLDGPLYALLTPYDSSGDIDYVALASYMDFLWGAGVRNILANGTTGEFASLTMAERKQLLEFCRGHWQGVLVNHVSACSVGDVLELIRHTEEPQGGRAAKADAILLLPPFYFAGPLEPGVASFLQRCLSSTSLPAYLYHFPFHVQQPITAIMYKQLAEHCPNLAGVKDSGGNLEDSLAFKAACPRLQVYVGNDRAASDVLRKGLDGSVTGAGNAVPETFITIHQGFVASDKEQMAKGQQLLNEWAEAREAISPLEPPIVKAGVSMRVPGFGSSVRPPFLELEAEHKDSVRAWLSAKKLL